MKHKFFTDRLLEIKVATKNMISSENSLFQGLSVQMSTKLNFQPQFLVVFSYTTRNSFKSSQR